MVDVVRIQTTTFAHQFCHWQNVTTCFVLSTARGRGRGRGRSRNDEEQDGTGGRPSGPSTLFDFLESKMGVFSIDGE